MFGLIDISINITHWNQIIPYSPEIPVFATSVLNYNHTVRNHI